jgi:hypothetical protein
MMFRGEFRAADGGTALAKESVSREKNPRRNNNIV